MFPYRAVVEWSQEDECFVARAPAFEALATHGDTPEEALHELGIAGLAVVEVMKAHGRTVPAPDGNLADFAGKIALRVPRSTHARLALLASTEGVSVNQVLVSMISEGLGRRAALPDGSKLAAKGRAKAKASASRKGRAA